MTGGRRFIGIAVAVVGLVVVAAIVVATALHLASGGAGPSADAGSQWATQTSIPEASEDGSSDESSAGGAGAPSSTSGSSHGPSASPTHSSTSEAGECRARDLELSIEGGGSKSRTLVVTNTGRSACTIDAVPELRFHSDRGSALDVTVDGSGSSKPVTLEPGESAEAKLTWSGSSHGSTARSIEATLAPGVTLEVRASLPISSGMDVEVKAWS